MSLSVSQIRFANNCAPTSQAPAASCLGPTGVASNKPHDADAFELGASDLQDGRRGAASSPKTVAEAVKTGDLLELAALIEEAATPEARKQRLETKDHKGDTPLLQAVANRDPASVGMLIYLGADLAATDACGRSPLMRAAALGDERSVGLLLSKPDYRESMSTPELWHSPAAVHRVVTELASKKATPQDIDAAAARLLQVNKKAFVSGEGLQKYYTHLESMKENPFGVRAEGWNFSDFLVQRVRSLLALAAKPEQLGSSVPDKPAARGLLEREISGCLETLRARRCNLAIGQISREDLREHVAFHEAKSVLHRLHTMPDGYEYSIPGGWAGHATYMNFARRSVNGQDVLTLRQDNLGAGRGRHVTAGDNGYPYVMNIPWAAVQRPEVQDVLQGAIASQLLLKMAERSTENAARLYDMLDMVKAQLLAEFGPIVVQDGDRAHTQLRKQMAGNCVVENHNAGMRFRLGERLSAAVTEAEKTLITRRMFEDLFTPSMLQQYVFANRQRIDEALQSSAKPR